jgi:CDP-diacylglycerol--serine O-phosphatidyltransferase
LKNDGTAKKTPRKRGIYLLPNILTTANLFCGFYAMLASMQGVYELASVVLVVAMVLDSLDGRIARMTNTMSKFGAEFDSLADLVTFGVAPAILVYSWSLSFYGKPGWLVAFLFCVCGALRLARFNIQIGIIESKVFNGLPIPGAASVVATGIMFYFYLGGEGKYHSIPILLAMVALALLMVSNVKYYSFKDLNFFSRKPFMSFVLIVIVMIIVAAWPQVTLFALAVSYSLSGPCWWLLRRCRVSPKELPKEKLETNSKVL